MNRRNFLGVLTGISLFPTFVYAALKPDIVAFVEGTTPTSTGVVRAPKVIETVGGWPQWQYGNYITYDHVLSDYEIEENKALCRMQAQETFATLRVPDACDKLEYIVTQASIATGDPFPQWSYVGWKVTIPAPQWQLVLSSHSDKTRFLEYILKTRKRYIPISLNGRTQMIPRAIVRDYLRGVA